MTSNNEVTIESVLNQLSRSISLNHSTSMEGYAKRRNKDDVLTVEALAQLRTIMAADRRKAVSESVSSVVANPDERYLYTKKDLLADRERLLERLEEKKRYYGDDEHGRSMWAVPIEDIKATLKQEER